MSKVDNWFIWIEANRDTPARKWEEEVLPRAKQALYTDLMELIKNIYTFEPFDDEEQLRNILEAKIKDYLGIEDEVPN